MNAVAKVLGILVQSDPQAALAHLDTLPESDSRRQAICDLFGAWGKMDPHEALRNAERPDMFEGILGSSERMHEVMAVGLGLAAFTVNERELHPPAMADASNSTCTAPTVRS